MYLENIMNNFNYKQFNNLNELALHAFGLAVYFPYQHPKLHQWGM